MLGWAGGVAGTVLGRLEWDHGGSAGPGWWGRWGWTGVRATGVRLDWARVGLEQGPLGLGLGSGWNGSRRGCGWAWAGLEWDRRCWVRVGAGLERRPLELGRWGHTGLEWSRCA